MSKLLSSQELVLHQINVERLSNAYGSVSYTQHAVGGSSAAAAAILTPEIHDRPEWFTALQNVPVYSLPSYLTTPTETAFNAKVRYIADKFDLHFLASKDVENDRKLPNRIGSTSNVRSTTVAESRIQQLEDFITSFELEAHRIPENSTNIDLGSIKNLEDIAVREIFCYWLRKRKALGGNLPCIPSLKVRVTEENQAVLCRSRVLGDCPIPFKSRDWESAVILRDSSLLTHLAHKRRKREQCIPSTTELCKSAISLSMQIFIREQLQCQHTFSSLYELCYIRSLGLNRERLEEKDNIAEDIPFNVTFGLPFLPSVAQ